MDLTLRKLTTDDHEAFLKALEAGLESDTDFLSYLDLQDPQSADSVLFGFFEGEIVGRLVLRQHPAGSTASHLNYEVLPLYRRQGFGTDLLLQALPLARQILGLPKLLIVCHENDIAAVKVVEKCGGVLELKQKHSSVEDLHQRRYWLQAL